MQFVVYGAGAVGSVLGGQLALNKHDVLLICRDAHAETIHKQGGLKLKSGTGEYIAHLDAAPAITPDHISQIGTDGCIFFTPKSDDTEAGARALADAGASGVPIVSFQNGVNNEAILATFFASVVGGVCRMTCSFLHPGQVTYRKMGRVVVGKYPKGADPGAKELARVLGDAGFEAAASNSIVCDKWLKLIVNLQSAFHAIIDPRDHDSLEFTTLKVGVLEEGARVLKADKISARSCDGRDLSIVELVDDLKKPRAMRSPSAVRVNNSTWQNLYLKRRNVENAHFHGPIIELAARHGIQVPFNEVSLELVTRASREGMGPGAFRAAEVLSEVTRRKPS